jgi:hypothetical protein
MMAEGAITVAAVLPQGAPISAASRRAMLRLSARTTAGLPAAMKPRTVQPDGQRQDVRRLRTQRRLTLLLTVAAELHMGVALLMAVALFMAVAHMAAENTNSVQVLNS